MCVCVLKTGLDRSPEMGTHENEINDVPTVNACDTQPTTKAAAFEGKGCACFVHKKANSKPGGLGHKKRPKIYRHVVARRRE